MRVDIKVQSESLKCPHEFPAEESQGSYCWSKELCVRESVRVCACVCACHVLEGTSTKADCTMTAGAAVLAETDVIVK